MGFWLRKIAKYYRDGTRTILRMDLCQPWQHFLLAGSFIALAVTGFARKWPESWIAKLLGSHEDFRRWSHRVAGIIMLTLGVYHVLYLVFSRKGRQLFKDFLPVKKDAADLAIIVWHFYHVMLDPDVYPVNFAFWDGKVSKHWHEEEHPLDHTVPGTHAPAETGSTPSPNPDKPAKPAEPGS